MIHLAITILLGLFVVFTGVGLNLIFAPPDTPNIEFIGKMLCFAGAMYFFLMCYVIKLYRKAKFE